MGWFLTSSKSKTKKKTKRGKSADPKWDPHRTLLGMKFAGAGGAVLAVVLVWHYGTQQLEAYVSKHHARPITVQDIQFSEDPDLILPEKINTLRAELAETIGPDPLDRDKLQDAVVLLKKKHDIVREVRQVRRRPDGTIQIDLTFRSPVAIVQMRNPITHEPSPDGFHVVDELGYHMDGPKYLVDFGHLDVPLILGVSSDDRPKDNLNEFRFQGHEVDSALRLIKTLRETTTYDHIDSISVDVTDEVGRIRLVINTRIAPTVNGPLVYCRIVWGLPPGQERTVEPDVDRKIAALEALLSDDRYIKGHWDEVWINSGVPRPVKAIRSE